MAPGLRFSPAGLPPEPSRALGCTPACLQDAAQTAVQTGTWDQSDLQVQQECKEGADPALQNEVGPSSYSSAGASETLGTGDTTPLACGKQHGQPAVRIPQGILPGQPQPAPTASHLTCWHRFPREVKEGTNILPQCAGNSQLNPYALSLARGAQDQRCWRTTLCPLSRTDPLLQRHQPHPL